MSKVVDSAHELREIIENNPVIAEFFRLKIIFESDEELAEMRKEIARLSISDDKDEYLKLKDKYNNHPLVTNYYQIREEVVALLREISQEIKI